jgi:NhaP-type Na+/H+ or K+/H+ antiporter
MKPADLICLFHALAGMCIGWMSGARTGTLMALLLACGGLAAGLITGFLLGRLPRAIRITRGEVPPKHRMFAAVLGFSSVALGAVFWWTCLSSICS